MVASMIGNFQDGSLPGKMQFGAAWWFLDQKRWYYQSPQHLCQIMVYLAVLLVCSLIPEVSYPIQDTNILEEFSVTYWQQMWKMVRCRRMLNYWVIWLSPYAIIM